MGTRSSPDDAINIRFGDSGSYETDCSIIKIIPVNNRRHRHVLNMFAMFCEEKKYQLLPTLTVEEIALILKDWACNMKRKDGHDYKESAMRKIWNETANLVQEMYYKKYKIVFDPFRDVIFAAARSARDAKCQQLKQVAGKRKQNLSALSEMINLYNEDTPKGLFPKEFTLEDYPSSSTQSCSEISSDSFLHNSKDNTIDDVYTDDDVDEVVDKKVEMIDIEDTQILLNSVVPLGDDVNPKHPTSKESDLFGEYVSKNLQQLPLDAAFKLQKEIQTLVMKTRLAYIRQNPSEAPAMVIQKAPEEEIEPIRIPPTNRPASNTRLQSRADKRSRNTDPPEAKRFKSEENQRLPTHDQQNQDTRTDCTVFAEHIALQLEQLPEKVSLRLQSEIYDLITNALLKPAGENATNRVKIKEEAVEVNPTEVNDYQSV